jgi:hypothetical protein
MYAHDACRLERVGGDAVGGVHRLLRPEQIHELTAPETVEPTPCRYAVVR